MHIGLGMFGVVFGVGHNDIRLSSTLRRMVLLGTMLLNRNFPEVKINFEGPEKWAE